MPSGGPFQLQIDPAKKSLPSTVTLEGARGTLRCRSTGKAEQVDDFEQVWRAGAGGPPREGVEPGTLQWPASGSKAGWDPEKLQLRQPA